MQGRGIAVMELRLRIIRDAYQAYSTSVCNLGFLFIALVYFIVKNKEKERSLLIYEVLGIVVLATPVLANRLLTVGGNYGNYWMLYVILCAAVMIAYAGADVLSEMKEKKEKILVAICFAVALQFGIGFAYTAEAFALPMNTAKASPEVVCMSEALETVEAPCVIAPAEAATELKKYNKDIKIIYGSDVSYNSGDLEQFIASAESYNCNCLIIETGMENEALLNEAGYQVLEITENYQLYTK